MPKLHAFALGGFAYRILTKRSFFTKLGGIVNLPRDQFDLPYEPVTSAEKTDLMLYPKRPSGLTFPIGTICLIYRQSGKAIT